MRQAIDALDLTPQVGPTRGDDDRSDGRDVITRVQLNHRETRLVMSH